MRFLVNGVSRHSHRITGRRIPKARLALMRATLSKGKVPRDLVRTFKLPRRRRVATAIDIVNSAQSVVRRVARQETLRFWRPMDGSGFRLAGFARGLVPDLEADSTCDEMDTESDSDGVIAELEARHEDMQLQWAVADSLRMGVGARTDGRLLDLLLSTEDFGPEHYERLLELDEDVVKHKRCSKKAFNTFKSFRAEANFGNCSICLENMGKGAMVTVLNCQHAFHRHCIKKWLTESRALCPLCNTRQLGRKSAKRAKHSKSERKGKR
mmetsp:Transcript_28807/g.66406  ORF Transcript_28807/g.66406 Transcript_28807/m.66406 type:complete len:268 (-) Transcript_28807:100-903(-)